MNMFLLICLLIPSAFASKEIAVTMVPRGKVVETHVRDYVIKTKAGTKIGIEFNLKGKFQEASGKNLNHGDELEPGDGLVSLSTAAQELQSIGLKPKGSWLLEEDKEHGWIYQFEEALISAKSGKLIRKINAKELPEVHLSSQ